MHSNSLLDSLVGWLLYLPIVAVGALFLLLCLLAVMMVRPLIIDWLGVNDHQKPMKTIEKAVRHLLPGDSVKITSRHKARTVSQVLKFTEQDQVPEEYRTKLLIIWVGCKQWLVDPEQVVLVEVPTVVWAIDAGPIEEVDMAGKSALGDLPF